MWRESAAGRFPKPVPIAARRVAFFQDEIDAWLARRVAERDAKAAA
jgi:prophage regulatory protein